MMNAPKLRFREFAPSYKKVKLSEVASEIKRVNKDSSAPIMMLSAGQGFILQSDKYSREMAGQSLKKYISLYQGELAYNHGASKSKPYGCCYMLNEKEARIPFVYHCFSIENGSKDYYGFYLNTTQIDKQLKPLISSTARMDGLLNISMENYMSISLSVPSLPEQQKIAEFLSAFNEKIEVQKNIVESLKQHKKGFMQKLFSQELRFTDENGNDFPEWEEKKLGDLCSKVGSGKTPKGGNAVYSNEGILFIRSQNVLNGMIDISDATYINSDIHVSMKSSEVKKDDILLNITGASIGRGCMYPFDYPANVNQHVCIIRINNATVNRRYILSLILSPLIQSQIDDCQNGGSREGLNFQQIRGFTISLPTLSEQQKIAEFLSTFDEKIDTEQKILDNLTTIKKGLLQQMFV